MSVAEFFRRIEPETVKPAFRGETLRTIGHRARTALSGDWRWMETAKRMSATGVNGAVTDKAIDSPTAALTRKRHSVDLNSSDDGVVVDGNRKLRRGRSDTSPQTPSLLPIPKPPQSNKRGPQKPPVPSHLAKFVPPRSSPLRKAVQLDPSRLPVRHVDIAAGTADDHPVSPLSQTPQKKAKEDDEESSFTLPPSIPAHMRPIVDEDIQLIEQRASERQSATLSASAQISQGGPSETSEDAASSETEEAGKWSTLMSRARDTLATQIGLTLEAIRDMMPTKTSKSRKRMEPPVEPPLPSSSSHALVTYVSTFTPPIPTTLPPSPPHTHTPTTSPSTSTPTFDPLSFLSPSLTTSTQPLTSAQLREEADELRRRLHVLPGYEAVVKNSKRRRVG